MPSHLAGWTAPHEDPLLTILGRASTIGSHMLHEFIENYHTMMTKKLPVPWPELKDWLHCYRDNESIGNAFYAMHPQVMDGIPNDQVMRLFRHPTVGWNDLTIPQQRCVKEHLRFIQSAAGKEHVRAVMSEHADDVVSELRGEAIEEEMDPEWGPLHFKKPEVQFLFKVTLPCLIEYGISPTFLMRRARLGKIKELEQLVRLDPSCIFDPGVAKYIHQLRETPRSSEFRKFTKAYHKGLGKPPKHKEIKLKLCAFLQQISAALGHRISSPSVQDLHDKAHRDSSAGLYDPDFPMTPTATAIALKRHKDLLHILPWT